MSEGRIAMNDAARDGELDLGAVGRTLVRKKWWVLGPAIAVAALTFVGVNLITPRYKSEARIIIEGRENVFLRPEAEKGVNERDRTVDPEAVTSQVQLALSRDVARQVIKELKLGERPGIRFRAARRVAHPLLARLPRSCQGSAEHDAGRARARSLLRAADRFPGRQVARDLDRIPVVRSGIRREGRERGRGQLPRAAAVGAARPDPRGRNKWLSGEIDVLRKQVAEAEAKVEEFRAKTNLMVGTNGTTLSSQTLGEVQPRSCGGALAEGRARVQGEDHPRHAQERRPARSPPT